MYCLGSWEHRRWGIDKDTARNAIAGAALAVSILPFMFGWLGKITRDARDRRIIEEAKGLIRQRPSISEMYRLHICIVVAQNKIDGRRVRREYRRPTFWVLLTLAIFLLVLLGAGLYLIPADLAMRHTSAFLLGYLAVFLVAYSLWFYVMLAIYIPGFRGQKVVHYFGSSRRPTVYPLLAQLGLVHHFVPASMFLRCYARTAIALKRRPYDGGFGLLRGFVDEEFTRRIMIELEHEETVIFRTASRLKRRQLFVRVILNPIKSLSPRNRRRISRRKSAHARQINKIVPRRLPSPELRLVLDSYIKLPSE